MLAGEIVPPVILTGSIVYKGGILSDHLNHSFNITVLGGLKKNMLNITGS